MEWFLVGGMVPTVLNGSWFVECSMVCEVVYGMVCGMVPGLWNVSWFVECCSNFAE